MHRAITRLSLFAVSALFAVSGYCADPDVQQPATEPVVQATGHETATENAASMDKVVEKVAEKAAQKAVEKTVQKATEHAVNQVAEKAAQKAVEQTVQKTTEHAMRQVVEKAAQKAVERTVEKAAEHAVNQVAEKAAEQAVKKAAAEAATQTAQAATRPDEFVGTTRVKFLVFVIDIDNIDDADENFLANIYVRLRWVDPRLASPGASLREMRLDSVWNPRVVLVNLFGRISKSLPDVVQVEPDGTVTYHQRYTGKLSQSLNLSDFPRDRHTFIIQFAGAGYTDDQLEFVPDTWPENPSLRGGAMADVLSLSDWKVLSYDVSPLTYSPTKATHEAGFVFRFEAERYIEYYLWQVVLPLGVVVMMGSTAFWFRREDAGVRIGIATSSVLTMIANRFVLSSLLPRLPYMTRLDFLSIGSMLLVFIALFLVVMTVFFHTLHKDELARRLDLWSRGGVPVAFALLLGWFLFL